MQFCEICKKEVKLRRMFCSKECLDQHKMNLKLEKYKDHDIIFVEHNKGDGKKQQVVKIRHNCPVCNNDKGYGFISSLKTPCMKCSRKNQKQMIINHNFYGQRKLIKHNDKIIATRSTYESFYIEYLKTNNIDFLYEPERFKLKNGISYLPDFYIPANDEYIELKGFMRENDKIKIEQFRSEYPNKKLKVLLTKDLIDLGYNINDYKKNFIISVKGIRWNVSLISNNEFIKRFGEGQGLTDFNNKYIYFNELFVTDKVILHELGHVYYSSCCTDSITSISNDDIIEIFCDIVGEHFDELYITCVRLCRLFYNSMFNRYGEGFKTYKLYQIDKSKLKDGLKFLNKDDRGESVKIDKIPTME